MEDKIINNNNIKKSAIKKPSYLSKISEKVYLGGSVGSSYKMLEKEKIHNVLSCIGTFSPKYKPEQKINQKIISIIDLPTENILKYLKECIEFIESSDKVYIHCMQGISRSASIVIAYFMWKNNLNYNDAFQLVKSKRPIVKPNEGFKKQLLIFEKLLNEKNYELNNIDFSNIKW